MHRILALVAAAAIMLGVAAPAALAAEPNSDTRSVVASIAHDVNIPAGDHVDLLVIVRGHADIAGSVDTIVVVDGSATLTGASARSLVVINGSAALESGTVVSGDVRTLDGTVTQATGAVVGGTVADVRPQRRRLRLFLIPLFLLLMLGLGVAASRPRCSSRRSAARQVRNAEALISREPGTVLVAGIVGSVVLPILAILTAITVVGAPLGLGALFIVLPAMAFFGWIVAAIFVGDWLLGRGRDATPAERPVPRRRGRRDRPRRRGPRPVRQRDRDRVRVRRPAGDGLADPPAADGADAPGRRRHGTARAEHGLTLEPRR